MKHNWHKISTRMSWNVDIDLKHYLPNHSHGVCQPSVTTSLSHFLNTDNWHNNNIYPLKLTLPTNMSHSVPVYISYSVQHWHIHGCNNTRTTTHMPLARTMFGHDVSRKVVHLGIRTLCDRRRRCRCPTIPLNLLTPLKTLQLHHFPFLLVLLLVVVVVFWHVSHFTPTTTLPCQHLYYIFRFGHTRPIVVAAAAG